MMCRLSIVIPTKNSAITLEPCLKSIAAQDYRDYEVIIVDSFSSDATASIAKKHGANVLQSRCGRSEARNLGFSTSHGSILLSIDSDMLLEPEVLGDIADSMDGHGGLIIPEVGYGKDFFSRCKDLEKRCYIGDQLVEAARAFSREAFEEAGGYDPGLVFGEDWDIHSRISSKSSIGRINSRILHDTSKTSALSQITKAYSYGKTLPAYLAKNHPQTSGLLDLRKSFFVRHFNKLKKEPLHATGLFFIKSFEYFFGIAGFLSAKAGF